MPLLPSRCPGCLVHWDFCFCAQIPRSQSRVRVLVLRHASERFRSSNTGWLVARVLGGELIDYGLPGSALDLGPLPEGSHVLWPSGGSAGPASTLFVLDGTWSQARKMRTRLLPTTPILSVPPPSQAPARLRRPRVAGQLSTIEAVSGALALLDESEAARALTEAFAAQVEATRRLKGYVVQPG